MYNTNRKGFLWVKMIGKNVGKLKKSRNQSDSDPKNTSKPKAVKQTLTKMAIFQMRMTTENTTFKISTPNKMRCKLVLALVWTGLVFLRKEL